MLKSRMALIAAGTICLSSVVATATFAGYAIGHPDHQPDPIRVTVPTVKPSMTTLHPSNGPAVTVPALPPGPDAVDASTCTTRVTCSLVTQGWEYGGDMPDPKGKVHPDCVYDDKADIVWCADDWTMAL